MVKTIDRYVLKELAVPFLVGTVAVVMMFLANTLIHYAGSVFRKEIPLEAILQFLVFKIPQTLNMTLPVGMTIAASLCISRLTRDSELTAIRAAGIPIRRVVAPIIVVGLLATGLSWFLSESVTPRAEAKALKTLRNIFASGEAISSQAQGGVLRLNNGEYHLSMGTLTKAANGGIALSDVVVFHTPKIGEVWIAQAASANYVDGIFTLRKPTIRQIDGERMIVYKPAEHTINIRVSLDDFFGTQLPEAMTAAQLSKTIDSWRSRGQDTRSLEVDLQSRYAVPTACLVFALIAPVVAFWFARGGAFIGMLVSIIVVFLYYNIWILSSQVLAKQWVLPPVVGSWLPNILFAVIGLVALWRLE